MDKEYVWYFSYGSNIKKERFMYYIEGGECTYNGRSYMGCRDKSAPLADKPLTINHRLYFANQSSSWGGAGVAFIEPEKDLSQITLGRMYLITLEQFMDIQEQECKSPSWYNHIIELDSQEGNKILTFTNSYIRTANKPADKYLEVIAAGLKEVYPNMSYYQIQNYLKKMAA